MLKFICTSLGLILLFNTLFAQQTINGFKRFGKADGLPNASNNKIFEGSDRFLWLSTESGLYRFDGHQFTPFFSNSKDSTTLSSNSISDIEEDRFGNLWVGTFGKGVNKLNKKTVKWKQYVKPTKDDNPFYWIFDLFKDHRGRLWLGTSGRGLLLYDEKSDSFKQFIPDTLKNKTGAIRFENEVRSIAADVNDPDILWLAGTDGLYRFNTELQTFTCYTNIKNGKAEWINNSFHTVYVQDKENIWLGAWGGGLIHFNTRSAAFTNYPPSPQEYAKQNLSRNIIFSVAFCSDSSLYVSTADAGLFEFNLRKRTFKLISEAQIRDGKNVSMTFNGITHTSDGSTWICSSDYLFQKHPVYERLGMFQSFYQPKEKFVYRPSLNGVLYRKDSRQYWMSCNAGYGVYVYDSSFRYLRSVAIEGSAADRRLRDIVADASGTTWLLSLDAPYLYYYDKAADQFLDAASRFKDASFITSGLQEMAADRNGNIWWVNKDQMLKWDPLKQQLQSFSINGSQKSVNNSKWQWAQLRFDANDDPWLATNLGLYHYKKSNAVWEHFYSGQNNIQSLANTSVASIAIDTKGNCWIAPMDEGLQLYDPSTKKFIKHYIQSEGFIAQRVNDLVTDSNGDVWAATINGLARYDVKQDRWYAFNQDDGLPVDNLHQPLFAMNDGMMILSVQDGFIHWNIHRLPLNRQKPIVYFNHFILGGKDIAINNNSIHLPYSGNELSIEFSAVAPVMGNRTKFYYKMLPHQKEWIVTTQRSISLAGFASGEYTLLLKAMNSDGIESEIKQLAILVAYPFWKKWWFVLMSILIVAYILYLLYRYRVLQLLQMQELRNSISRDLHDEIGSSVSSVNMLALVAKKQLGDVHPVTPLLTQIGQSAQNAGDSIDEIIWSVNPGNDSAQETINRLRKYLSDVFELHGIEYNIHLPEIDTGKKLSMQVRRDLWLICKEAINNIVKYAKCSKAEIEMEISRGAMQVKISDNGVGFEVKAVLTKKRNGLRNMKERVQKYKTGKFEIYSKPNNGTTLLFQLPMNE